MPPQKPIAPEKPLGQREGHIGAEHIERAMGEIHDARHAENDRQAGRDQKQRTRRSQDRSGTGRHKSSSGIRRGFDRDAARQSRSPPLWEGESNHSPRCRQSQIAYTWISQDLTRQTVFVAIIDQSFGRTLATSASLGRKSAPLR